MDERTMIQETKERSAEQKQELLWQKIQQTQYDRDPPLTKIDLIGLFLTSLSKKMDLAIDEAPQGWKKAIHAHGIVAKIKFVAAPDTPFTGLFRGVDYALLRASVTGDPSDRGFAPGLAIKFLIDGKPSANFSALVSLVGQGQNYNFFDREFSNIVPVVNDLGPRLINLIFSRVTRYPTKLYLEDFAKFDQKGQSESNPHYPSQIFLAPNPQLKFLTTPPHDFRDDLKTIPANTKLFTVFAVDPTKVGDELIDRPEYRQKAQEIGHIETSSPFIASSFGDSQLFFRHQRFRNR
jgi:hypothetical protein